MRSVMVLVARGSAVLAAQSPPSSADDLRFEVVSIKRNLTNALGSNGSAERPDGGFVLLNVPMMTLVARAQFPIIPPVDMVGLPEWARSERYDVRTVSPLGRPATPEERAAMIRAMLVDRVKLETHVEAREMDVFDLVRARADGRLGGGITPSEVDCVAKAAADRAATAAGNPPPRPPLDMKSPPPPCSGLRVSNGLEGDATMENFILILRSTAGRPIVDKTELKGSYRIKITFAGAFSSAGPSLTPSADDDLPNLFSALPDQVGLKLQPSKGKRDVLVVDRLERPTED